jgi:hypothetical protein
LMWSYIYYASCVGGWAVVIIREMGQIAMGWSNGVENG